MHEICKVAGDHAKSNLKYSEHRKPSSEVKSSGWGSGQNATRERLFKPVKQPRILEHNINNVLRARLSGGLLTCPKPGVDLCPLLGYRQRRTQRN